MPLIRRPLLARGFSMLEVLLALAVMSLGLLGAAAMLLDSVRIHGGALRRIAATQLARDMAERILANPRARAF
ncbi:MAG TPA: type IV pilus modification protein PilV, partial [Steroidobacteraceae bacterium]|nr:type IV pilus modification protein PilV [Steroidobacteraceae bacterium]